MGNYRGALEEYLEKSKEDPRNADYKHKIGACYLNIAGDKSRSIPYLKEAINLDPENLQAKFDLAKSYHFLRKLIILKGLFLFFNLLNPLRI